MTVNESMSAADMGLTEQHCTFESSHLAIYESEAGDMTVECIHDDDSRDVFATFPGCGDEIDVVRDLISEINRLRDSTTTLQADLAAAVDERDRLAVKIDDLETEIVGWQDGHAEWQTATGLLRGEDPAGVTPGDLSKHIQALSRLEQAAREWRHTPGASYEARLIEAIDALPPEAP